MLTWGHIRKKPFLVRVARVAVRVPTILLLVAGYLSITALLLILGTMTNENETVPKATYFTIHQPCELFEVMRQCSGIATCNTLTALGLNRC